MRGRPSFRAVALGIRESHAFGSGIDAAGRVRLSNLERTAG
jgi:hypothetical protein